MLVAIAINNYEETNRGGDIGETAGMYFYHRGADYWQMNDINKEFKEKCQEKAQISPSCGAG